MIILVVVISNVIRYYDNCYYHVYYYSDCDLRRPGGDEDSERQILY